MPQSFQRIEVLGATIDRLGMADAVNEIISWCASGRKGQVVTVNLDFLVKARRDTEFAHILKEAELSLADGMPLLWASYLSGSPLQERVAGADLIVPLCREAARMGHSIFLMGATLPALTKAATQLVKLAPGLDIAGVYAPPFGFNPKNTGGELDEFLSIVRPDILFVALGAPKQEIWGRYARNHLPVHAVLGIGAGIEFIAGVRKRAPRWLQHIGLEWAYRFCREPGRLGQRYLECALILPSLILKDVFRLLQRGFRMRTSRTTSS
jgi:N-acetylglucosaminyldiphosphoundecaprenol N-acetyl-beta-D-mannosaminyltransferase